jgi:SAM-dependent methyltransferase
MLTTKQSPQLTQQTVNRKLKFINRFLPQVESFLEVGPGDCALSLKMAEIVKQVYAVDVSEEITKDIVEPNNFQLIISDGSSIPVPSNTIDLAYSNQLMEHLHPNDAYNQLKNIYAALKDSGKYICITPNRFYGPSDISKYFDDVATGFHLKEYTIGELSNLFKEVGFSKAILYAGGEGIYIRFPLQLSLMCEKLLNKLPSKFRKACARFLPMKAILGIKLIGLK